LHLAWSAIAIVGWSVPKEGYFDSGQMEQVLVNLIKNAHESGSPADAVELEISATANVVAIEVRDRGAGMSEAVLANAFLPFYSTKRTGTGLGLAVAREIIDAHGGRLTLNNRVEGGLSVNIYLPETQLQGFTPPSAAQSIPSAQPAR
jgi:signal transduction histidine kinase